MLRNFITGIKSGIKIFGELISTIVNTVLLLFVYLFAVGLTALVARLANKKFLNTSINKDTSTYWTDLNLKKKSIEDYYKQF